MTTASMERSESMAKTGKSGLSAGKRLAGIPDADAFRVATQGNIPKLEGSEKQVKWAEQIRASVGNELITYALTRTSDGRPSRLWETAQKGKAAIADDVYNSPLVKSTTGALRQSKISSEKQGYVDLAGRVERLNRILTNPSAKFWIDHRTNSDKNYLNQKLKKYIDGK